MTYCGCDYDLPSVYSPRMVVAKKQYNCCECNGYILRGESHQYLFAIWDGNPSQLRTCLRCVDVWNFVEGNIPCACLIHGSLFETAGYVIEEVYHRAHDEVAGLWFGYQRRVILCNRHNERAVAQ